MEEKILSLFETEFNKITSAAIEKQRFGRARTAAKMRMLRAQRKSNGSLFLDNRLLASSNKILRDRSKDTQDTITAQAALLRETERKLQAAQLLIIKQLKDSEESDTNYEDILDDLRSETDASYVHAKASQDQAKRLEVEVNRLRDVVVNCNRNNSDLKNSVEEASNYKQAFGKLQEVHKSLVAKLNAVPVRLICRMVLGVSGHRCNRYTQHKGNCAIHVNGPNPYREDDESPVS